MNNSIKLRLFLIILNLAMLTSSVNAQATARVSAITLQTEDLLGLTDRKAENSNGYVTATISSANLYAGKSGSAAYPSFGESRPEVTALLIIENRRTADIKSELTKSDSSTNDLRTYHTRVSEWGKRNHLIAFPTFVGYPEKFEACLLEPSSNSSFGEIEEEALSRVEPAFKIGVVNPYQIWARAVNNWALSRGYIGGIATFSRKCSGQEPCFYGAFLFANASRGHYVTNAGASPNAPLKITNTHPLKTIIIGVKRPTERSYTRYKLGPGKSVYADFSNNELLYFISSW